MNQECYIVTEKGDFIENVCFCDMCRHNMGGYCEILTNGNITFKVSDNDYCSFGNPNHN